jgi:hypothetical protein
MKTPILAVLACACLTGALVAGASRAQPDPAALAYTPLDQIQWKSDKDDGPLYHVIWGDPEKPGSYAMLVKWLPHRMSRPHNHPHDRHIVVISGT